MRPVIKNMARYSGVVKQCLSSGRERLLLLRHNGIGIHVVMLMHKRTTIVIKHNFTVMTVAGQTTRESTLQTLALGARLAATFFAALGAFAALGCTMTKKGITRHKARRA